MSLTDSQICALKPQGKQYKKFDEKGLYLLIKPTGSKLWQHRFRVAGKEKVLSYGPYPESCGVVTIDSGRPYEFWDSSLTQCSPSAFNRQIGCMK